MSVNVCEVICKDSTIKVRTKTLHSQSISLVDKELCVYVYTKKILFQIWNILPGKKKILI